MYWIYGHTLHIQEFYIKPARDLRWTQNNPYTLMPVLTRQWFHGWRTASGTILLYESSRLSDSTQLPTKSCCELLLLTSFDLPIFAFLILFLCTALLDFLQRYHSNLICMNWWGQPQNSCLAVKGKFCSRAVHTRLLSVNVQATEIFYLIFYRRWADLSSILSSKEGRAKEDCRKQVPF